MDTNTFADFPFEEIRRPDDNMFNSWKEAEQAGFKENQIWSVTDCDGDWTYGPPTHYVNIIGFIATAETHDGETYYHELEDRDEDET